MLYAFRCKSPETFFDGVKTSTDSCSFDMLVHEFCKLLGKHGGKHGAPEYAHGGVAFPDFVELMSSTCKSSEALYFQQCTKIRLERQVGSRYFVTAANAGKVFFLREAAISFLKYIGKDKGNDKKVNHRLHASYQAVEEKIFFEDETDKSLLYPLLASGATSMKEKLLSYAQTQLPGGKYWEPDQSVKTS